MKERKRNYKRGIRPAPYIPAAERVESVSAQFDREAREHRRICSEIVWAQEHANLCIDDTSGLLMRELAACEERIVALGRKPPLRSFRMREQSA